MWSDTNEETERHVTRSYFHHTSSPKLSINKLPGHIWLCTSQWCPSSLRNTKCICNCTADLIVHLSSSSFLPTSSVYSPNPLSANSLWFWNLSMSYCSFCCPSHCSCLLAAAVILCCSGFAVVCCTVAHKRKWSERVEWSDINTVAHLHYELLPSEDAFCFKTRLLMSELSAVNFLRSVYKWVMDWLLLDQTVRSLWHQAVRTIFLLQQIITTFFKNITLNFNCCFFFFLSFPLRNNVWPYKVSNITYNISWKKLVFFAYYMQKC